MSGPLAGIRVLDFSRVLAGPYCAMLLGDLGADVIKIERPGLGDDTRQWGPPFVGGESAYFLCCNRNKFGLTLNLQSPAGRELAARLAAQSDVLIENFLPGTMQKWGLGYDQLSQRHPGLVYCSITGFGQTGPYRDLPGYDIIIQGLAGIMSITGEPDGAPMKVGVAIADITAGLFASNAILAALVSRGRTDRGERIDISLFDSTVAWLANVGANYLATGDNPERHGNAHATIVPYQLFQTADRPIIVAVGNDGQFRSFCKALQHPEWIDDDRFRTNPLRVQHRAELIPLIDELLQAQPAEDWLQLLTAAQVPCGPVNTLDRVFSDPQLQSRQMLLEVSHPTAGNLRMVNSPCQFPGTARISPRPPPRLGEHTLDILRGLLSVDDARLQELRTAGVI